ncbi:MAG: DUF4389 domain-containing protein [Dehalococcoidia bacterium]
MAYPVSFDVQPPQTFDKAQVVLRILLFLVLSWFLNGILGAAYWLLPIIAAIMIAQKGAATYLAEAEKGPTMWLRYIMGAYSYLALASDKLPFEHPEEVDLKVQPSGTPSVGSALLRIILAIPHAIVLGILGFVFFFIWIISAISILINETYPDWAQNFIRGYLRWTARVLAYLASLVDEYPPFSFDSGEAAPAALPPTQPSGGEASGSGTT